jgi:hypothetical protein
LAVRFLLTPRIRLILTLLFLCGTLLCPLLLLSPSLLLLNSPLLLPLLLLSRTLLLLDRTLLLHLLRPNLPLLVAAIPVRIAPAVFAAAGLLRLPLGRTTTVIATAAMRVAAATVRITATMPFTLTKPRDRKHKNARCRQNYLSEIPPSHDNYCLPVRIGRIRSL